MLLSKRLPDSIRIPMSSVEVGSLGERIHALHDEIRRFEPGIERMACALYDPQMDLLHTFVNSTEVGTPLTAYAYKLADSASLNELAKTGRTRVIDDIPSELEAHTETPNGWSSRATARRSRCRCGSRTSSRVSSSSNSTQPALFAPAIAARLEVYGRLVALMISHQATAVRSLIGSAP